MTPSTPAPRHAADSGWGWLLAFGILIVALGLFVASHAIGATIASVYVLGWVMAIGGALFLVSSFTVRAWNLGLAHLMMGAFYLVTAFLLLRHPLAGATSLTLMMALFFLVAGAVRVIDATVSRGPSWGWKAVNGVFTLLLGLLIISGWPSTSLWVLGLYVGLDLVFAGVSWSALALASRHTIGGLRGATT